MANKEKNQLVITVLLAIISALLVIFLLEKAGVITIGAHKAHADVRSFTEELHRGEEHIEHAGHIHSENCGHKKTATHEHDHNHAHEHDHKK